MGIVRKKENFKAVLELDNGRIYVHESVLWLNLQLV